MQKSTFVPSTNKNTYSPKTIFVKKDIKQTVTRSETADIVTTTSKYRRTTHG